MKNFIEKSTLILLALTGIILIALQIKVFGFLLLGIGSLLLLLCRAIFRDNIVLIYASLAILGISPIDTGIDLPHMIILGTLLVSAIALPYLLSTFLYKDHLVTFQFHHGRAWKKTEILYVIVTGIVSYFAFPYFLKATGSYMNWTVEPGVENLILLFIGTNALGIWDELFFVNTVLGILRHHLPFAFANLLQSILFTSFLYELGFRGYFFVIIFLFALLQGYIYKKTESLFYVITIHLVADLFLYLALIHLHHPSWPHIFLR